MSKYNKKKRGIGTKASNFSAQHRLISKRLIYDMIQLAQVQASDTILDIGAGTGALTIPLAETGAHVIAIESDSAFAHKLLSHRKNRDNIRVKHADILKAGLPKIPFVVVANIPYSITTPILGKLLDDPSVPLKRAVLLVEKGAAKRFTAASLQDPRILSWRMHYEIRLGRTVSPQHFAPPPKVDSAILSINRRRQPLVDMQHQLKFRALAAYGLRNPRLPLSAALSGIFTPPQITRLVRVLGMDRELPMCGLNEEQWAVVFHTMLQHVPPNRWPRLGKNVRNRNGKPF